MATKLVVTAPLVIGKTSEGRDLYLYHGAGVDGQSKEWRDRHLRDGLIGEVDVQERDMPTDGDAVPPAPEGDEDFLAQTAATISAQASGVDEDRRARLAVAEEAGKNRSTVIAALLGPEG